MIPRADKDSQARSFRWRSAVILTLVVCGAAVLVARAVEIDGNDNTTAQVIRVRSVEQVGMYRGRPYRFSP